MDRGRVGTLAIGNKAIREGMVKHQQDVHLGRIQKIQNRKPGTSNTLDNTAPVVVKAALNNPRKAALKLEFNEVTERENRVLLQKISAILTAPPKITDEDYVRMRKIVQNLKGGKQRYEEEVQLKHHRIYLKHLKTMGPYYKPKDWELDYRRQLRQQKFMRQVTYKPKSQGIVKVPGADLTETVLKPRASSANDALPGSSRSAGHVNRVRNVKRAQSTHKKTTSQGKQAGGASREEAPKQDEDATDDDYRDDYFDDEVQEQLEELAHVERLIRVTMAFEANEGMGDAAPDEEEMGEEVVEDCAGRVNCWLADRSVLVIATKGSGLPGGKIPAFDAEAEIDVLGLAEMHGIDEDKISSDSRQLANLARYIAGSVEVRIEDGEARVILNLAASNPLEYDVPEAGALLPDAAANDEGDPSAPSLLVTAGVEAGEGLAGDFSLHADDASLASAQQDVDAGLLDDTSAYYTTGVTIQVQLVYPANSKKSAMGSPVHAPKKDQVLAIAEISLDEDEQISIDVQICSNSATKFRGKPAIVADSKMKLKTGLPSIMHADLELLTEYFRNISKNLVIEHHVVSGVTSLSFSTPNTRNEE